MLDFNRSGVPLVEIVTKPVIKSSKEAVSYIEELRQLVIDLKISEGKLEKGNLRFDANISVAKEGDDELGVKVEIKNMNSFRSVFRAINFEIERQAIELNSDNKIIGAVGVIGPTRLNYGRIVPIVDYTAQLIGKMISDRNV